MIPTTLVTGASACAREAAIASVLEPEMDTAVILEGFPDTGNTISSSAALNVVRIGAACPCCNGNLIFRVTLNRILRHPPQRLYIGLANGSHLELVHRFLCDAPYDKLLSITKDIRA